MSHRLAVASVVSLAIGAAGVGLLMLNLDLPVVRNGLVYGTIAYNLLDHRLDVPLVLSRPDLSFHKPIGFSVAAVPLVWAFGANLGMKLASTLGALLLTGVALAFFRRFNATFEIREGSLGLEQALLFVNPLLMYQFWSAYPDVLFAALFVLTLVLFDIALAEGRTLALLLGAASTWAAVVVKEYGLVLLPIAATWAWLRRDEFRRNVASRRRNVVILAVALALLAGLALAHLGLEPRVDLGGQSREVGIYRQGLAALAHPRIARGMIAANVRAVVLFLLIVFNVALALLCWCRSPGRAQRPLLAAAAIFVGGLLVYPQTWYNTRFFVPIAPIVVLYLARGYQRIQRASVRRLIVACWAVASVSSTLAFNTRAGATLLEPAHRWIARENALPPRLSRFNLDSLRMHAHTVTERALRSINASLPPGATLYFVSDYYADSETRVYVRSGLLRPDLVVRRLASPAGLPTTAEAVYVFVPERADVSALGPGATPIGPRLYRVPGA